MRRAQTAQDLAGVMALRAEKFGVGPDKFDDDAVQMMVMDAHSLRATFRLTSYADGATVARSYAAQFYDLSDLSRITIPALELGRFCVQARGTGDEADILRLCFAAMAAQVDQLGAGLLFGCASFDGTDPAPHKSSLGLLRAYQNPAYRVGKIAAHTIDLEDISAPQDVAWALRAMPPLLRSYLAIGGWVGDHVVQDFGLGTLHIFTAVDVGQIPQQRAAALRALARQINLR